MATDETPTTGNTNLTQRDLQLLAGALTCVKGEASISIDYEKFATFGGFKNANSSKAAWHGLKKKLDKMTTANGSAPATPSKKGGKRKKSADDAAEDQDVDAENSSPAKKTTKTPVKGKQGNKKSVKAESDGEDVGGKTEPDDEEE